LGRDSCAGFDSPLDGGFSAFSENRSDHLSPFRFARTTTGGKLPSIFLPLGIAVRGVREESGSALLASDLSENTGELRNARAGIRARSRPVFVS